MRFKFCGDDDCPDWLLGQVNNMAKLSHIKLKLLLQTIVKNILAGKVDYEKLQKFTADAKFSDSEVKGCVSGLTFIVRNSVKFSVDSTHLINELQQIGFPKEHAQVITDTLKSSSSSLTQHFISSILKLNAVISMKCSRLSPSFVKLTLVTTNGTRTGTDPSLGSTNGDNTSVESRNAPESLPNGQESKMDAVSHALVLSEKTYSLLLQELLSVQKRIEGMSVS